MDIMKLLVIAFPFVTAFISLRRCLLDAYTSGPHPLIVIVPIIIQHHTAAYI